MKHFTWRACGAPPFVRDPWSQQFVCPSCHPTGNASVSLTHGRVTLTPLSRCSEFSLLKTSRAFVSTHTTPATTASRGRLHAWPDRSDGKARDKFATLAGK